MTHGYKTVRMSNHHLTNKNSFVYEHVLVAEQKLRRNLKSEEVVHHIDKNRANNDLDNLMVFATTNDHTMFHRGGIPYKDGDVWRCITNKVVKICLFCNKEFITNIAKRNKQKYCSQECSNKARTKSKISIEELQKLLYEYNGSFTEVGRIIGVKDTAIIRRLQRAKLPFHKKDYML